MIEQELQKACESLERYAEQKFAELFAYINKLESRLADLEARNAKR